MRLTQSAGLRKDEMERLINRLGGDTERWGGHDLARSTVWLEWSEGSFMVPRTLTVRISRPIGSCCIGRRGVVAGVRRQWVSLNRL